MLMIKFSPALICRRTCSYWKKLVGAYPGVFYPHPSETEPEKPATVEEVGTDSTGDETE